MDDVPLIEGNSTRNLKIDSKLSEGLRRRLIDFLRSLSDCFAWSHLDMLGINPEIIMHQLQVDPLHQPIRQKRRKFAPERDTIINEEIKNLSKAGFIREVQYLGKRLKNGESALISRISTSLVQRTPSLCLTSISLSMPPPNTN